MSRFVETLDSLDNTTRKKNIGENLHCQYDWSENLNEKIVQLYFQLVRTKSEQTVNNIADMFIETFIQAKKREDKITLLKLLVNTRDIIQGKGERALCYAILHKLSLIEPFVTKKIIKSFVFLENEHSIGSWADIKYMWDAYTWSDDFERFFIELINNQLRIDLFRANDELSLAAKWVPRSTNKHKSLFRKLALSYYRDYFKFGKNARAENKACMNYRKLVTIISRRLDVTQIKQCSRNYSTINFNKVTSITMNKQKNAFLNSKNIETEDRINGAKNFKAYINHCTENQKTIKGKRVSIYDFVKDALRYGNDVVKYKDQINILNSQWKDGEQLIRGKIGNFIAMVDTSGSMEADNYIPLYNAVGLGIRVAEKSLLGKRIMTFNTSAAWINLEDDNDFVSMVSKVKQEPWGMNTNFMNALTMILECIIEKGLRPHEVSKLTLCIFSDMQIDYADKNSLTYSFWENIKKMYYDEGMKYYGVPYETPNILFWNMRVTKGFPVISRQNNVSMLSGFNPVLLNTFCNKGEKELESMNSHKMLLSILNVDRYNFVEKLL